MRFGQWWQRAVRTGHAYAQVSALHPEYSLRNRLRILVYGVVLPLMAALGMNFGPWLLVLVLALYLVSFIRSARSLQARGFALRNAYHQSAFLVLSKLPNLIGMLTYYWRKLRQREMVLIEYK
jgi:hypothetical protein